MNEAWKKKEFQQLALFHEIRQRQAGPSAEFVECPEPAPSQLALSQIYQDVLHENDPAGIVAKRLGDWVLLVSDRDTCYDIANAFGDILMLIFSAARELSSRKHLQILADLTVELANLPGVYNNTNKPMVFGEGSIAVQPGESNEVAQSIGRRTMDWATIFYFLDWG